MLLQAVLTFIAILRRILSIWTLGIPRDFLVIEKPTYSYLLPVVGQFIVRVGLYCSSPVVSRISDTADRDRELLTKPSCGLANITFNMACTLAIYPELCMIHSMDNKICRRRSLLRPHRKYIFIQPKLYASDLLDLVASHFKLREKHYFGLGFYDETYHFNWLQGEKRVLDHEFPKKTGLLVLHFSIRYYVETIGLLRDTQTVELFYLNARQAIFRMIQWSRRSDKEDPCKKIGICIFPK
ncbi:hypothetical protein EGW08_016936 [Elysia chlorotica]|uniref:FERM domain-containing protein n=1 Tax=Elysia chlorotica TaxID=188477 RepID=A0A3S1HAA7_ELYCH|nr:hypothetical protein EGW08_016936 [Elysia chlorotica]